MSTRTGIKSLLQGFSQQQQQQQLLGLQTPFFQMGSSDPHFQLTIPILIPHCFDSNSDSTLESNPCFKDLVGRENARELALKLELELEQNSDSNSNSRGIFLPIYMMGRGRNSPHNACNLSQILEATIWLILGGIRIYPKSLKQRFDCKMEKEKGKGR